MDTTLQSHVASMTHGEPEKALTSLRLGPHSLRRAAVCYQFLMLFSWLKAAVVCQTFNKLIGLLAGPCSWCLTNQARAEGTVGAKALRWEGWYLRTWVKSENRAWPRSVEGRGGGGC